MSKPLLPGSTIGVLGSGQLGRMMAIVAHRMGYRVEVYSPDQNSPAGQVAHAERVGAYDDEESLAAFAQSVDVVTLEFENVPAKTIEIVERSVPVRPGAEPLAVAQNRFHEKNRLCKCGLPTAPYQLVKSAAELSQAVEEFGGDGILKTTTEGYDGKGQYRITSNEDAADIWNQFERDEGILEGVVDFVREFSVIGVRSPTGEFRAYDPIINHHSNHILDVSIAPADAIPQKIRTDAIEMTSCLMDDLQMIGVLCVEFFQTSAGEPVINEIAPRPHNSGHLTIDAHVTCQFEQQVRSVCGLPLGSTEQRQPAAMANLLGDLWSNGEPAWLQLLEQPTVKLHLYGKVTPKPGRKMGHMTVCSADPAEAEQCIRDARRSLLSPAR